MTTKRVERHEPVTPLLPKDFDEVSFELGIDGFWRAYDDTGVVAIAPTFREIFERTGGRWN